MPRNAFVTFMLEQFGRPRAQLGGAVRLRTADANASVLQVLSLANHPQVWQKIADPAGPRRADRQGDREPRDSGSRSCISARAQPPADDGGTAGLRKYLAEGRVAGEGLTRRAVEPAEHARVFVATLTGRNVELRRVLSIRRDLLMKSRLPDFPPRRRAQLPAHRRRVAVRRRACSTCCGPRPRAAGAARRRRRSR